MYLSVRPRHGMLLLVFRCCVGGGIVAPSQAYVQLYFEVYDATQCAGTHGLRLPRITRVEH